MDVDVTGETSTNHNSKEIHQNRELTQDQHEMLEFLSSISDLRVKNQQLSESDFSKEEKLDVLKELFSTKPLQFLLQFGKFLQPQQLDCFHHIKNDDAVSLCLKQLMKNCSSDAKRIQAKNRRYAALQKLVDTTDYFTEEEMQRRNPILYDQLIGRFQSKQEKEEFLKRSYQMTTSSTTPLTDLLMAHMNRNEDGESYRRLDQEQQKVDEDEADAEYIDHDSDEDDDNMGESNSRKGVYQKHKPAEDENNVEEIEDEEKEVLKEEFFTTMYQSFLEGKDTDFDYSTVDNNEEYDIGENVELDAEEKYFDDEEPAEAVNMESNSDVDEEFKPPVKCSTIESKIKLLTVHPKEEPTNLNHNDDTDEEDELDKYMKSLEHELQN